MRFEWPEAWWLLLPAAWWLWRRHCRATPALAYSSLELVAAESATVSLLVPTMINAVVNASEIAGADLASLRLIFYGGGPMPPAVLARALETLPCGFTQGYGLTETLEATFLVARDHLPDGSEEQRRRLQSAGREAVGAEVRVVGPQGEELPAREVGEILVRSRSVISGYWQNGQETREAIRGGWFHTGDLGFLDEERYLFVVDRLKDMVVSGGMNIYTKEVEDVLIAMADYPLSKEQEYIGLKMLYNLSKYATVPDFLAACASHSSMGITGKQIESIKGFIKALSALAG